MQYFIFIAVISLGNIFGQFQAETIQFNNGLHYNPQDSCPSPLRSTKFCDYCQDTTMDNEHLFFECDNVKTLYDYCGIIYFLGTNFCGLQIFCFFVGKSFRGCISLFSEKKLYLFCRGCKLLVRVNSWIRASQEFRKN